MLLPLTVALVVLVAVVAVGSQARRQLVPEEARRLVVSASLAVMDTGVILISVVAEAEAEVMLP
jgi:hypothetical protein